MTSIPDFDDLPKVKGMPQGCAWGVFDKDGKKDVVGTLNNLSPEVIAAAAKEVKDGVSISLNWPLNGMIAIPGRKACEHTVNSLVEKNLAHPGTHGWDDELSFNTQISSQWDSMVHLLHQPSAMTYNGHKVTKAALSVQSTSDNPIPTIEHWHARGGLVGRGVLIDYKEYHDSVLAPGGEPFHPFDGYRITVDDIETVAKHQRVEFHPGDVLIVRTGTIEAIEARDFEKLKHGPEPKMAGVHGCTETARWVWNKRFSAVAGDAQAFEAFPPIKEDGTGGWTGDLVLHQWFLALFGMSIGELFDLKELAAYCKKTGRYSFMFTSAPLNHPGLVASPPNALAVF